MMIRANRQTELRNGFTLVELLIVMMIIGLLASMVLVALAGAQESARVARTRAQLARIDALLQERWESFRTRRIKNPFTLKVIPGARGDRRRVAEARLDGVREIMRMEMPDRKTDVLDGTSTPPTLWRKYNRMKNNATKQPGSKGWTAQHQGGECLYMILKTIRDGDSTALEFFRDSEIGDVDGDGMREILDGWGRPIEFLRWAPGFLSPRQDRDPNNSPDPFDPLQVDIALGTFALYPLVFSAGPDGSYDIVTDIIDPDGPSAVGFRYAQSQPRPNNPYTVLITGQQLGEPADTNGNGKDGSVDNLYNHLIETGIRQ